MNKLNEPKIDRNYSYELTTWDKIMLFVLICLSLYLGYRGVKWLFTSGVTSVASSSLPLPSIPAPSSGMSVMDVMKVLHR